MNTTYKRFDITSDFGKFLVAIVNNDVDNLFVYATKKYPNHVPVFNNFIVTDESKNILKNYTETQIYNDQIQFGNIELPFIPDENDIFAIFDTYTLQDDTNPRSIINFNYFYNPTITNFMKICRIRQYIYNDYIVFADKYIFVNTIIADMLRRIRYVINVDDVIYTQHDIFTESFTESTPIIDMIQTDEQLNDILSSYGNELYEQECDDPNNKKIEVVVADFTGDTDNESKLGNRTTFEERRGINMSSRRTANPVGRMTIYNDSILEDDEYTDSDLSDTDDSDLSDTEESEIIDDYDYNYTMENPENTFEDTLRLQALWTVVNNSLETGVSELTSTPEFNKWMKKYGDNLTKDEFLVSLLRDEIPLNSEDVDGVVFFNTLDVLDFLDIDEENTDEFLDTFNTKYGNTIVWDDNQPFELAYPDVFNWILSIIDYN